MFMTDGTRERISESRAPQSRARSSPTGPRALRCSRTVGSGLLHFAASSLSLSRTSSAVEKAAPAKRSQTGIYGQASTQSGPARSRVCCNQRVVDQRGGQPGVAGVVATRARAWVSRNQFGNGTCSWNIGSTVYGQTSWCKPTSYWCQSGVKQSEERPRNQRRPRQR